VRPAPDPAPPAAGPGTGAPPRAGTAREPATPVAWRRARLAARVALGGGLLAILLTQVALRDVVGALRAVQPWLAALLCLLTLFIRLMRALNWNLLLRTRGVRISHWQAIRLSLIGQSLGAWTPGGVSGEAYRIGALYGFRKTSIVLATILFERHVRIAVLCLMACVALPCTARYLDLHGPWTTVLVVSLAAISMILVPALLWGGYLVTHRAAAAEGPARRYLAWLLPWFQAYLGNLQSWSGVARFIGTVCLETWAHFVVVFVAAQALHRPVPISFLACTLPVVFLLIRLPVTFQAIGVQEGLLGYLFLMAGHQVSDGLAAALVLRAALWLSVFLPGLLLLGLTRGPQHPPLGDPPANPT